MTTVSSLARLWPQPILKLVSILALAQAAGCGDGDADRPAARTAAADGSADASLEKTCVSMEPDFFNAFHTPGRVCVESVPDEATWKSISIEEGKEDRIRSTKWFVPRTLPAKIPPTFLDANTWAAAMPSGGGGSVVSRPWHMIFAVMYLDGSPAKPAYVGADRVAYTGNLVEVVIGREVVFGYELHDSATISCQEQQMLHQRLRELFSLRPLARVVISRDPPAVPELPPDGCQVDTVVLDM